MDIAKDLLVKSKVIHNLKISVFMYRVGNEV